MTCAACGTWAPDIAHEFYEGRPERPGRKWTIFAPLYFKSNADNTEALEGYCSPECSTAKYVGGRAP